MRLKYFRSTSKAPVLTARKSRVRNWLHNPRVTISRPHALTPQYSAVVTQLHTNCYSFSYPGGMEASSLSYPGIEPGPLVNMSEYVSERLTPQPTELVRQTKHE